MNISADRHTRPTDATRPHGIMWLPAVLVLIGFLIVVVALGVTAITGDVSTPGPVPTPATSDGVIYLPSWDAIT